MRWGLTGRRLGGVAAEGSTGRGLTIGQKLLSVRLVDGRDLADGVFGAEDEAREARVPRRGRCAKVRRHVVRLCVCVCVSECVCVCVCMCV